MSYFKKSPPVQFRNHTVQKKKPLVVTPESVRQKMIAEYLKMKKEKE